MAMAKEELVKRLASDLCEFFENKYRITNCTDDIRKIVYNDIGYILDVLEERAIELEIT